jgi:hypothetical protein
MQIEQCPDDRTAGDGRQHPDTVEQLEVRESGDHADVEERGSQATTRQRHAEHLGLRPAGLFLGFHGA